MEFAPSALVHKISVSKNSDTDGIVHEIANVTLWVKIRINNFKIIITHIDNEDIYTVSGHNEPSNVFGTYAYNQTFLDINYISILRLHKQFFACVLTVKSYLGTSKMKNRNISQT